jgi:hypothetical protein
LIVHASASSTKRTVYVLCAEIAKLKIELRSPPAPTRGSKELAPAERVDDIDRILFELRQAVRETLAEHRRNGHPVAVWRDGRVQWIPANEIPLELATLLPEWE